jgi:hypothetical protein
VFRLFYTKGIWNKGIWNRVDKPKKIETPNQTPFSQHQETDKMATYAVVTENLSTHEKHIYECESKEEQEKTAKAIQQVKKLQDSRFAGHKLTTGPIHESIYESFGASNKSFEIEDGMAYVATSTSNSSYSPHKRAKTMNKIQQAKDKNALLNRLRRKLEAKQAAVK